MSALAEVFLNAPRLSSPHVKAITTKRGGLTLAGQQVPPKAALSLPLLGGTGERKHSKRLVGRDKGRGISQQLLSRAKQTELGKVNLLLIEPESSNEKQNQILKTLSPHPSLLPGLNFTPNFLCLVPPSSAGGRRMGVPSVHHTLCLPLLP